MRRLLAVSVVLFSGVSAAVAALPGPASATTVATTSQQTLRLNGIGPLKLGMSRTAAVKTGWLSNRSTGCELGGPPLPIVYRLKGAAAPKGIAGSVTFNGGKLTNVSLDKGVRTDAGVTVGTTTLKQMVARYRSRGYKVNTDVSNVFGGTFVRVAKGTRSVIDGFGSGTIVTSLGLPFIATCD
jgi:hypothetical protein